MRHTRRITTAVLRLVKRSLDAFLLLAAIAASLLGGCLLRYDCIPIRSAWANRWLAANQVAGMHLQAEHFHLKLNGELQLHGVQVYSERIRKPLIEADYAAIQYAWPALWRGDEQPPRISVANGTLHLPAVYAPDGQRTAILERMAFHLQPSAQLLRVDSFAAMHQDMRLRGTVEWPIGTLIAGPQTDDPLGRFYQLVAAALREKKHFAPLIEPTLTFDLHAPDPHSVHISSRLSCDQLKHTAGSAENFSLDAAFQFKDGHFSARSAVQLRALALQLPSAQVAAQALSAQISREQANGLLRGIWPELEIAARQITVRDIELAKPAITLAPQDFPVVHFAAACNSLNGALTCSGHLNTATRSGQLDASGSVDLLSLLPAATRAKLPRLEFESAPHYHLSLCLKDGFAIDSGSFKVSSEQLRANAICFDHIAAAGSFSHNRITVDDIFAQRGPQWLEASFALERDSQDYTLTLVGDADPKQYNALLPRWWAAIFRDFRFTADSSTRGDFIIHGNTQQRAAKLYWGHAALRNVHYKEVPIDQGDVIVRGRGRYVELPHLEAHSGGGWARGKLAFTSRKDAIRAPVSVRYDFDARMPLTAAQKLFGANVAALIDDFEVSTLPEISLSGVRFNPAYPEYAGHTQLDLTAVAETPLEFKQVPLDHLQFTLHKRADIAHLRELHFGYAQGSGNGAIDILSPPQQPPALRFKLALNGAHQTTALQNLPKLTQLKPQPQDDSAERPDAASADPGRVDLRLHAQGPLDDWYQYHGYGDFALANEQLGAIQLLGPLSKLLQNTPLNFTSFNLNTMQAQFEIAQHELRISQLQIDGPQTQIKAKGTLQLEDQALDMRVRVNLLANIGAPDSPLRKVGSVISRPLKNLLEFDLSGTLEKQKLRSLFDPRNLIPGL